MSTAAPPSAAPSAPTAAPAQPATTQQKVHVAKEILHVFEEYKVGVKPNSFIVITGTTAEQGSKYPPNTFRLCLIEDVWLTIHLNSSGYLILKAEADPNPTNPSATKYALSETRPHIQAPFESMDGLLNSVSGEYRNRFQERLCHKLEKVVREREKEGRQE
ncbi:hypothetical protein BCR33DRAFT_711973 [Rhizoclosmatium globosum]|uniref:GSKIP domain-containing protein n=1 Tax=Rhizoclosmatium globosum TaxID=329046 RepID=A0A1Y2CXM7_9FUNG|nr:hypothetical protein HDU99_002278 [Rhizoclosmatium hyalinum]KAJ3291317.1 hypothetical protein HDU79_002497 [Rhizoclosmatium sp. JEL0117]ORY51783.1 hypothetical protein BCR33DRAFT_711973 [Rhizoclosmatium globosum]|eukprot:ORY51783.1 hypothetical protein BCR33DRAFT_711973 [Rhizoclosmatium globosum]